MIASATCICNSAVCQPSAWQISYANGVVSEPPFCKICGRWIQPISMRQRNHMARMSVYVPTEDGH